MGPSYTIILQRKGFCAGFQVSLGEGHTPEYLLAEFAMVGHLSWLGLRIWNFNVALGVSGRLVQALKSDLRWKDHRLSVLARLNNLLKSLTPPTISNFFFQLYISELLILKPYPSKPQSLSP